MSSGPKRPRTYNQLSDKNLRELTHRDTFPLPVRQAGGHLGDQSLVVVLSEADTTLDTPEYPEDSFEHKAAVDLTQGAELWQSRLFFKC